MTILDTGNVKFRAGQFMIPGTITPQDDGRLMIGFRFNKTLIAEIKAFEGARWNPERKKWTVKATPRNLFQLEYLLGRNPYARFDAPLVEYTPTRPLYEHQVAMVRHGLTRHYALFAVEMGCGKTLSAIEVMEASGYKDWYWVGPKSALRSVQLEFEKWRSRVRPRLFTYESLKKEIGHWTPGRKAPHGVVFDESSRLKNPTAQRSQAAMELANGVREDWGDDGYVILMSGTPAPKSPADWWMTCETACPGFLREGTIEKFKRRLGLIVEKESMAGGVYPELVTWRDSTEKCAVCGMLQSAVCHDPIALVTQEHGQYHVFTPGVNEVELLYKRMQGLVLVQFKSDCLSLPEKRYEIIRLTPSASTLRAASLITARSTTVIGAMTLLRELSDGFQYSEETDGEETCPLCKGLRQIEAPDLDGSVEVTLDNEEALKERYPDYRIVLGAMFTPPEAIASYTEGLANKTIDCPRCGGDGTITRYRRVATMVPCPKEDALKELLDRHDDVGRIVLYAGFSGSVDRVEAVCLAQQWEVVRVDGRGWQASWGPEDELNMLRIFQTPSDKHPRVAFVGQPSAAGFGLTLTASPTICYWSNDFNGESRWQSEDRAHRAGMDLNRGCTIIDLVHLPTDEKVLENLQKKRDLQALSMGELRQTVNAAVTGEERRL